MRKAV